MPELWPRDQRTKTVSGTRVVHVPPPFWPLLQTHIRDHAAPGLTGLLLPGDRADHTSVGYLMGRWSRPAKRLADLDLTIHHLRHTALTLAGQHGATAAELQARAGHATLDRDNALAEKIGRTYDAGQTPLPEFGTLRLSADGAGEFWFQNTDVVANELIAFDCAHYLNSDRV